MCSWRLVVHSALSAGLGCVCDQRQIDLRVADGIWLWSQVDSRDLDLAFTTVKFDGDAVPSLLTDEGISEGPAITQDGDFLLCKNRRLVLSAENKLFRHLETSVIVVDAGNQIADPNAVSFRLCERFVVTHESGQHRLTAVLDTTFVHDVMKLGHLAFANRVSTVVSERFTAELLLQQGVFTPCCFQTSNGTFISAHFLPRLNNIWPQYGQVQLYSPFSC